MDERTVRIATYHSRTEAELARAALSAHEIEAHVESDDVGGSYPWLQRTGAHLNVRSADASRASQILSLPVSLPDSAAGNLAEAEAEVRRASPHGVASDSPPWHTALTILLLGAVIGYVLGRSEALENRWQMPFTEETLEEDQDLDGRSDAWFVYAGPKLVRSRFDRNSDGNPDDWYFFQDGVLVRSEDDADFDGKIDGSWEYEVGNPARYRFDADRNGVWDFTTVFRHGVTVSERFHPNGGPVEREERYVDGVRREVFSVGADGSKALIRSYDSVGHELTNSDSD